MGAEQYNAVGDGFQATLPAPSETQLNNWLVAPLAKVIPALQLPVALPPTGVTGNEMPLVIRTDGQVEPGDGSTQQEQPARPFPGTFNILYCRYFLFDATGATVSRNL